MPTLNFRPEVNFKRVIFSVGYAHGTGDHLRHIVCIVCLDRFSLKKTIGSF